jgi:DNA mismatch endonuclease, patch repair protein
VGSYHEPNERNSYSQMDSLTHSRRTSKSHRPKNAQHSSTRRRAALAVEHKIPFKKTERSLTGYRPLRTTTKISIRMSNVRQRGTEPELLTRQIATSLGLRYTLRNKDLPGSPDLANRSKKWALFVHGCFWHRHPGCKRASTPRTNRQFWSTKFERNVERDAKAIRVLRRMHYKVAVIWECAAGNQRRMCKRLVALVPAT